MSVSAADKLLTPDELAERWQIVCKSKKSERVYRLVRDGVIPQSAVVRLGPKNIRFTLEGIEAFKREGGSRGPCEAAR